jgi:hypothetical protein
VRNQVSNIVWKLQAQDRDEVVSRARCAGLGAMARGVVNHQSAQMFEPASASPPFGREREWAELEAAWNAGLFTYITGPAGVGKTHLMRAFAASRGGEFIEFSSLPSDRAIPYASYACSIQKMMDRFPNLKLEPWITMELRRILPTPEMNQPEMNQPIYTAEEAKIRLCAAIVAIHVALVPQLTGILLDDIQYDDASSAEVSMYTVSSWKWFTGNAGEAPRFLACFRLGMFPPEIEQGIRQQAQAGDVALVELEPVELKPVEFGVHEPVLAE